MGSGDELRDPKVRHCPSSTRKVEGRGPVILPSGHEVQYGRTYRYLAADGNRPPGDKTTHRKRVSHQGPKGVGIKGEGKVAQCVVCQCPEVLSRGNQMVTNGPAEDRQSHEQGKEGAPL